MTGSDAWGETAKDPNRRQKCNGFLRQFFLAKYLAVFMKARFKNLSSGSMFLSFHYGCEPFYRFHEFMLGCCGKFSEPKVRLAISG